MATDIKEEIANYLLNNCFLMGTVDTTREKYYYVINHEESFRQIFLPIGYTLVIHRNLRVVQLINNHGSGRIALRKYESIILLIFRLLYVEKRESLSTNEDRIYATVEEIKNEYEKLNLPRKFDRAFLEDSIWMREYRSILLLCLQYLIPIFQKHMMKLLSCFLNTKILKRRMKNDKDDKTSSDKLA